MKTNKLIAAAALIAVSTAGLSYSYADEELSTTTTKTVKEFQKGKFDRVELTDEQKAEMLEKREQMQAQKQAHEDLIDALLAGETLTADQETLRVEMIEKRAEMKAKRLVMQEKKEEIKSLLEKVKAGETLTNEEQASLDTFKSEYGGKKFHGKMKKGEGKKGNKGERKGINKDVESETL